MDSTRKRSYVEIDNEDLDDFSLYNNKMIEQIDTSPYIINKKSKRPRKNKDDRNKEDRNNPPKKDKNNNCDETDDEDDANDEEDFINFLNLLMGLPPNGVNQEKKDTPLEEPECRNKLCDHKTFEEDSTIPPKPTITNINSISDLIELGKHYHCKKFKEYDGLNLRILCNLIVPLTELNDMIGLHNVKVHIIDQILFFLRGYNKNTKCNRCVDCSYGMPCAKNLDDMLHTVITGPPGVGKTQFGKILAKVYKEMGVLSKGHFKLVTRADLIGEYLGHTAVKTQKAIDSCVGGVMFIDEAYALGHSEKRDSFSKECIDTLNQNLSEKRDFLCIIAGYEDALEKCFFSMNDGLKRRFTFKYDIKGYNDEELLDIFLLKVRQSEWSVDADRESILKFFTDNLNSFPNYGGDIETLFLQCKIAHCRKLFGNDTNSRTLSLTDIEEGFKSFVGFRHHKDVNEESNPDSLYL